MKKYVIIPMLIALFVLYCIDAKSGDCSGINSLITDSINDFDVKIDNFAIGRVAKIDFKFRPATATTEGVISIDWSTMTDKHPGMTEESLKEFVLNAILRKMGRDYASSTPLPWGVYTTSKCFSTINCVIKVDTSRNVCCDSPPHSSPINTWQINGETFMSIPLAKYYCSTKCCKSYYQISRGLGSLYFPTISVLIERIRSLDQVISDCSPDSGDVAPHCLLSSDSTSPYWREWDPNPKSSTCEGGCP